MSALRSKVVHMACKVTHSGAVSALCFSKPRAIDLSKATWTTRDEAVTCPKCKRFSVRPAGKEPKG